MESLRIRIINPKAKKILKNLADLNLIDIRKSSKRNSDFKKLLHKLRTKFEDLPSLEEITKEVEAVRQERYAKK